ncbi:ABC transporter permease [Occultella glacieicola]|uniref:ABC transporter permease n=1 Tax=Occultella glacieicola TaxID=2518684 RepID=A0ABY2E7Z8_9MICO|nr:ABC transporter permease [Occultella glacieicola]TDE97563.1 ABC transporter permease [Occultella glacieicola]
MTGFVGALVEAWGELRIHRLRVLLSLIGVAVAVAAMTGVTALGDITRQAQSELMEAQSGRPATFRVDAWSETGTLDATATTTAFRDFVTRYEIEQASLVTYASMPVRMPTGTWEVQVQAVDPPYGAMHRIAPVHGSWFTAADADRFAPALVVNEAFLRELGVPDLTGRPTALIGRDEPVRATIIGVTADLWEGAVPEAFILSSAFERWIPPSPEFFAPPALEVWVPPEDADVAEQFLNRDLTAALGSSAQVQIYRQDAFGIEAFDQVFQLVVTGIGLLVLMLGALSLVNISLVTVRQRIREIGIRRSFGASSGRIFFSIMMESLVATVLAGAIGVAIAVVAVRNAPIEALIGWGSIQDVPPFPISAAVTGLVAATVIGALAGLLPALVAVRVKPIDAIRY